MENKVLIKLTMPTLNETFDLFLPVNEVIWKIKKMLIKSISDLTGEALDSNKNYVLLNKDTCEIYHNNDLVIDTDIRNGTELFIYIPENL